MSYRTSESAGYAIQPSEPACGPARDVRIRRTRDGFAAETGRSMLPIRDALRESPVQPRFTPLLVVCLLHLAVPGTSRAQSSAPCWRGCDVLVGAGTTYYDFSWTNGLVLPVTLEVDQSRWELGAFRFASSQRAPTSARPPTRAANPYWGVTAMRRWQVLHRGRARLYLGFGANYRSELDYLEPSRWNFAYVIAARHDVDRKGLVVELAVRHWSDAWIRRPNRGQDLLTLSVGF